MRPSKTTPRLVTEHTHIIELLVGETKHNSYTVYVKAVMLTKSVQNNEASYAVQTMINGMMTVSIKSEHLTANGTAQTISE